MSTRDEREQILDELRDLPKEHLEELLHLIRYYKIGVQASREARSKPAPLDLAGVWSDMSEEEAEQVLQLYKRRKSHWTMRKTDV
jgi:hypothetical protein